MYSKDEIKELKKRLLKVKSKNKYNIIKALFEHEKIISLDPSTLCALIAKKLSLKQELISYDSVRKWRLRYIAAHSKAPTQSTSLPYSTTEKKSTKLIITNPDNLEKNDNNIIKIL